MLRIDKDGIVSLTRGDTAYLTVAITHDDTGADYQIAEDDTLVLTIKKKYKDVDTVVRKEIQGTNIFHIEPEDTNSVEFGKYVFDVQITTADGDVYTVIEPTTFEILPEVTY